MKNRDLPAMPVPEEVYAEWVDGTDTRKGTIECSGLTKREHFAAMTMQGIISSGNLPNESPDIMVPEVSKAAIRYADAMLKALAEWR